MTKVSCLKKKRITERVPIYLFLLLLFFLKPEMSYAHLCVDVCVCRSPFARNAVCQILHMKQAWFSDKAFYKAECKSLYFCTPPPSLSSHVHNLCFPVLSCISVNRGECRQIKKKRKKNSIKLFVHINDWLVLNRSGSLLLFCKTEGVRRQRFSFSLY